MPSRTVSGSRVNEGLSMRGYADAHTMGYYDGVKGKPRNFVPRKYTLGSSRDYETGYLCGLAVLAERAQRKELQFNEGFDNHLDALMNRANDKG